MRAIWASFYFGGVDVALHFAEGDGAGGAACHGDLQCSRGSLSALVVEAPLGLLLVGQIAVGAGALGVDPVHGRQGVGPEGFQQLAIVGPGEVVGVEQQPQGGSIYGAVVGGVRHFAASGPIFPPGAVRGRIFAGVFVPPGGRRFGPGYWASSCRVDLRIAGSSTRRLPSPAIQWNPPTKQGLRTRAPPPPRKCFVVELAARSMKRTHIPSRPAT